MALPCISTSEKVYSSPNGAVLFRGNKNDARK